jgi:hypothetical protein
LVGSRKVLPARSSWAPKGIAHSIGVHVRGPHVVAHEMILHEGRVT